MPNATFHPYSLYPLLHNLHAVRGLRTRFLPFVGAFPFRFFRVSSFVLPAFALLPRVRRFFLFPVTAPTATPKTLLPGSTPGKSMPIADSGGKAWEGFKANLDTDTSVTSVIARGGRFSDRVRVKRRSSWLRLRGWLEHVACVFCNVVYMGLYVLSRL